MHRTGCALLFVLVAMGCGRGTPRYEGGTMITMTLMNGRIWTGNPSQPEAEAIVIAGVKKGSTGFRYVPQGSVPPGSKRVPPGSARNQAEPGTP